MLIRPGQSVNQNIIDDVLGPVPVLVDFIDADDRRFDPRFRRHDQWHGSATRRGVKE